MNKFKYLWQTLLHFREMGTVIPSSRAMCNQMTGFIDPGHDKVIIELGAGDGVITRHILSKMAPDAILFVFEINPELCETISSIKDNRMKLINDDARTMNTYLQQYGYSHADHIISAIPFLILPENIRKSILNVSHQILKNQGLFIQLHYSKSLFHLYQQVFGEVETKYVPINIPPGYVFKCVNKNPITPKL